MKGIIRIVITNKQGAVSEILELAPFTKGGNVSSAGKHALEVMMENSEKGYGVAVSKRVKGVINEV